MPMFAIAPSASLWRKAAFTNLDGGAFQALRLITRESRRNKQTGYVVHAKLKRNERMCTYRLEWDSVRWLGDNVCQAEIVYSRMWTGRKSVVSSSNRVYRWVVSRVMGRRGLQPEEWNTRRMTPAGGRLFFYQAE
jgi:hypothetical protein